MLIPPELEEIISKEVSRLTQNKSYDLSPKTRLHLFDVIGASTIRADNNYDTTITSKRLPPLTLADRIRARIAIITAQRASASWDYACKETDNGRKQDDVDADTLETSQVYLSLMQHSNLEEISVFKVPRPYVPQHILAMAELALMGNVKNQESFLYEANEWWGIYPTPKFSPREFSIKWSAQEALYLSILFQKYSLSNYNEAPNQNDLNEYANHQVKSPAGYAMLAYAGIFDRSNTIIDIDKRCEFWLWWLTWAIPLAYALESNR